MPLKAVLFDMDGVIVDTEPLHRKAYFNTFKDLNIAVSEEFYTSLTGTSTKKSTHMIKDEFNLDVLPEEIAASKENISNIILIQTQNLICFLVLEN